MARLDRFLWHRRWIVLAAWGWVVLVALPLAKQHTDRLTGAFNVPGSQSNEVRDALQRDFEPVRGEELAAVLVPEGDAGAAQLRSAVERVAAATTEVDHVEMTPTVLAQSFVEADRGGTL